MSDDTTPRGGDFLDRLIARHAPVPRTGVVRVRPRLPGPFERIEAVRARGTAEDDATLVWPTTTPSAEPRDTDPARPAPAADAARLLIERERTVVRTEPEPHDSRPFTPPAPEPPLLRPATPVTPVFRPAPDTGRRTAGRPERAAIPTAASAPIPPGADAAPPTPPAAAPHPRAADTAVARDAVRQAAARRAGRAPEQVVQVQIGRLEVTAGPPPSAGPTRRAPVERPAATVSLADYLARGRE
ncbi:hypothetical protein ACIG0D_24155 [Streptomyces sp. NPDC052773]|uniref:hypothetical protein n=1 Tax=Streptomyces sp. NPDC052773 TaxID=3365693 RepID=UPI0037D7506A